LLAVSFTNLDYYYVEVIHAGVQCLLAVSFSTENNQNVDINFSAHDMFLE